MSGLTHAMFCICTHNVGVRIHIYTYVFFMSPRASSVCDCASCLFLVTVMSDAETTEATQMASLLRKFGREASSADKAKCNAVVGGKRAREDFRQQWADARKHIKTAKGSVSSSSIKTKMDTKEAIYQPFAMVVKGEGGQVDLLGATKRAANIARK